MLFSKINEYRIENHLIVKHTKAQEAYHRKIVDKINSDPKSTFEVSFLI